MGFFDLFRKQVGSRSLADLKVDIHSHLLPGIDDGAPTMDHTIGMLRKMEELGYQKLIMTPHVMAGVYENTSEIIQSKLSEVQVVAKNAGLNLQLEASAEYFYDETLFQRVESADILPFHGNHVLFELSFRIKPTRIEDFIFLLKTKGYQPVIAHFERYFYFHPELDIAHLLKERGCLIQVNWNSFAGHYGPEVKAQAMRLLYAGLIDILGTDCHRIEHLNILEEFLKTSTAQKVLNKNYRNHQFL